MKTRVKVIVFFLLVGLICLPFSTGRALLAQDNENIVIKWNNIILSSIRNTHLAPPQTARALAIVHTCIYDGWAAYDKVAVGTRFGGTLRRPENEHTVENKEKAVSFAAYRALIDLVPTQKSLLDNFMKDLGYDPQDNSIDITTPAGIGNKVANAVIEFRHADGSNQLGDSHPGAYSDYTNYMPVNPPDKLIDPNKWQPLPINPGFTWRHFQTTASDEIEVQKFLTPHWGMIIPFALMSGDELRPPPPAMYPSKEYTKQAQALIRFSARLDDRKKVIAEYWFDGPNSETPPGHWCLLAQSVSKKQNHTLDEDVKMYFALTNALFDASIAVWESKRFYDSVRPITAIHFLFKDKKIKAYGGPEKGTRIINGENWGPYLVTPPHTEHVSGHSTFSAASAEILKLFTGSDDFGESYTAKPGSLKFEPGRPQKEITLHWNTFTEAALEAGLSRRYGGIHFFNADNQGQILGRKIATLVWNKAQEYFKEPI